MKKVLISLSKIMVLATFVVAQLSANTTCTHMIGQDELPEQVKKLRRF